MIHIGATIDIPACLALRRAVFIDEQGVSEADEIDTLDGAAIHLLARVDGQPMGTARLLIGEDIGKIGRVCVLAPARGRGIGAALIRAAMTELRHHPQLKIARLGAQLSAIPFYERLGFTATGPVYYDAAIAHRDMTAPL